MCGIIGIIGKTNEEEIKFLLKPVKHRGSIYDELEVFQNGGMGINRLPIVDPENGKQPVSNKSKTIFAVMNGEIFNHNELRKDLIKKGYFFQTNSDTELIPALYEEYGLDFVDHIDSEMYAIIIFDKKNNDWIVTRDPLGVKPLYYTKIKDKTYFSSEAKQLVSIQGLTKIKEFPAGTIWSNNQFKKYFNLNVTNKFSNEKEIIKKLKILLESSVKKRVQTNLPIGVFLSGGLDSTLIMELACKYHKNVTAIILGTKNSVDAEYAIRYCREKKYKFKVIEPDIDYGNEIDNLIYYLESYEPHIIRHSFGNNLLSKTAHELGLKIVLVGEGADELFGGYNNFSKLNSVNVNKGCLSLLNSMSKGNLMRVDKLAMRHTIEIRSPFFDKSLLKFALNIDGSLKLKRKKHKITTKYILRKVAKFYLPKYIFDRYKEPLANGAGLNIGFNFKLKDGILAKIASKKISNKEFKIINQKYPEYKFTTKEEILYFKQYQKYGFDTIKEDQYRLNSMIELNNLEYDEKNIKLLVAEFDYLALYFPVYLANTLGFFKKYDLEVDFISTGGDDKTFFSLIENSAEIGLSDTIFATTNNKNFNHQCKIIGELVNKIPLILTSFKSNITIDNIKDLNKYNLTNYEPIHFGTYQIFSTTNTLSNYFINKHLSSINHSKIKEKQYQNEIDLSITLAEQAFDLEYKGAYLLYDFKNEINHFLMTGFTISTNLEKKYIAVIPHFLQAVKDSLNYIYKNKKEALKLFENEFKKLSQPKKTFEYYLTVWNKNLKVGKKDLENSISIWKKIYPQWFD